MMMRSASKLVRTNGFMNGRAHMNTFRRKTFKEVWLGDSGYHPLVGVFAVICILPIIAGTYFLNRRPDTKSVRSSQNSAIPGDLAEPEVNKNKKEG